MRNEFVLVSLKFRKIFYFRTGMTRKKSSHCFSINIYRYYICIYLYKSIGKNERNTSEQICFLYH